MGPNLAPLLILAVSLFNANLTYTLVMVTHSGVSLRDALFSLLGDWCEGLLRYQLRHAQIPTLDGGIFCPDCARVHGRCADAVSPFLKMARETGAEKWIDAALALQKWSDNVSCADGSFLNEPTGTNWKGITVFAALSLGEALRHHGDLLPDAARQTWTERLRRAADYLQRDSTLIAANINYPISGAAALTLAAQVLDEPKYRPQARRLADDALQHFAPNGILGGEGGPGPSPRGVLAVDALYNLEESLPNFALYARLSGDERAQNAVLKSFSAHLDFLLPDGSYDAGWGSRSYKWTLWGSRTSDGVAGLLPLAKEEPRIGEWVRRNLLYLRRCTHDGLLYGGPDLKNQGRLPCIHHTFAHAKALASALDEGVFNIAPCALPCDAARGIIARPEVGAVFVALHAWRASFCVSDVEYQPRTARPSGGALSMLWHPKTGPLCVASMSVYQPLEGGNMASPHAPQESVILTPHLKNGEFLSCLDTRAVLHCEQNRVTARGVLTNPSGKTAGEFQIETRFLADAVEFQIEGEGVFWLPLASPDGESVTAEENRLEIQKMGGVVVGVESNQAIRVREKRIFNFVPGIQAVALEIPVPATGATLKISVI